MQQAANDDTGTTGLSDNFAHLRHVIRFFDLKAGVFEGSTVRVILPAAELNADLLRGRRFDVRCDISETALVVEHLGTNPICATVVQVGLVGVAVSVV